LPAALWGNAGATVDGCTLLSIGGQDAGGIPRNDVFRFNASQDTWTPRAPMPEALFGLTAAVLGERVFVVGGYTASDPAISDTNYIYVASSNAWTSGAPIPFAGGIATAAEAAAGGQVYVIGGDDGDLNSNATNMRYDPTSDTWTARALMPTPRENNVAVALRGKIYVAGGIQVQQSFDGLRTFEVYDIRTNTWTPLAPMSHPRISPGIATDGEYIYVFGGAASYSPFEPQRTAERYHVATGQWGPVPRMVQAVDAAAAGYVAGRLVSAGGGYTDVNQYLALGPNPCARGESAG
jgi:N-acetylneuraminic acid mutarotase